MCLRCKRSSRHCDGYETPKPLFSEAYTGSLEIRYYQFFTEKVLPELADHLGNPFWSGHVRQVARMEPAIRHIVLAIGAYCDGLERLYYTNELCLIRSDPAAKFALTHSTDAIKLLNESISECSTEILLLSSVLFVCMLQIIGEYGAAIQHLSSALWIVRRFRLTSDDDSNLSQAMKTFMLPLLSRLETQYSLFFGHLGASDLLKPVRQLNYYPNFAPQAHFHNLFEAQKSFDLTLKNIMAAFGAQHKGEPHVISDHAVLISYCVQLLSQWQASFEYQGKQSYKAATNQQSQQTILYLKIQHILAKIMVETIPYTNESIFDKQTENFRQLLDCADTYLDIRGTQTLSNRLYGFELRILWPLLVTGCYCRHPCLRRRAASLLNRYDRQEGPWDSRVGAHIVMAGVNAEEEGLDLNENSTASDIPEENRMKLLRGHFLPKATADDSSVEGAVGAEYMNTPYDPNISPVKTLWVSWNPSHLAATDKINPVGSPQY